MKCYKNSRFWSPDSGLPATRIQNPASVILVLLMLFSFSSQAQSKYQPAPENLKNREWFQDAKFGLLLHWGGYSVLGEDERAMNNQQIPIKAYEKLPSFFNPTQFDPADWLQMVNDAVTKYITITSK